MWECAEPAPLIVQSDQQVTKLQYTNRQIDTLNCMLLPFIK